MIIHIVDAASTEGRDPIEDIYAIDKELENYNSDISKKPQVIAANKIDMLPEGEQAEIIQKIRNEFEPKGIKVFATSTLSGKGLQELLYYVSRTLSEINLKPVVFEQEFFPDTMLAGNDAAYTVQYDSKEHEFVIEGPKIEKMLGYTNLDSEKGFAFFQKFLKDNGILKKLEALNIHDGDTVRMYGLSFEYYRNGETAEQEMQDEMERKALNEDESGTEKENI